MDQNAKKQAVAKAAIEYVEADSIVEISLSNILSNPFQYDRLQQ